MENYRFTLPQLATPGKLTAVYAVDGGAARNAVLTTMATLLAERGQASEPVLMIDWDLEAPGLHEGCGDPAPRPGLLEYFAACRDQLAVLNGAALQGRPGHEPPGHERPGHERPGHERPGHERPVQPRPTGQRAQREPAPAGIHEGRTASAMRATLPVHGQTVPEGACLGERIRARQVVEAVDWEPFVERVDQSRSLYLMRAGCLDDSYGERAGGADWEGLFAESPSLFRCFAEHLGRRFSHILVASGGGRSAAVSVCTSLIADRLLMLFSPSQRSLDGACGVVRRAIDYRSSHEEAQRPLLVYPVPVELDATDHSRRMRWRYGDTATEAGGYQSVVEQLMRESYALTTLSLDSYFNYVHVQQLTAMPDATRPRLVTGRDRLCLATAVSQLLEWTADGAFPWEAKAALPLLRRIASARAHDPRGVSPAVQARLADDLLLLGQMQQSQGRAREALDSIAEGARVQCELWGAGHADTRASRKLLGGQLRLCGEANQALAVYRDLYDDCASDFGHNHADTLAARAGLAAALADCGQFDAALGHAEQVALGWRERVGLNHRATLEAKAAHAALLALAGEPGRARMLLEQVLEGRERVLGPEHEDTLASLAQLAAVLRQQGLHDMARGLQERLLAARERLGGSDHEASIDAGVALAETVAAQCDLARIAQLCGPLAAACQRRYGRAHPSTRSAELQLASSLAGAGGLGLAAISGAAQLPPRPGHATVIAPHEAGFDILAGYGDASGCPGSSDERRELALNAFAEELERTVTRLERVKDLATDEARELADRLREPDLLDSLAPPVRARGVRAILDVYFQQGDMDALIAFMQEQKPMPIR